MANFGGYGQEPYGDPFGAGGPLQLLRARAMKSLVVRVVFNEEPLHESPAGFLDALNPANYLFSIAEGELYEAAVGSVGTMLSTGVDETVLVGPVAGVLAGEYAVDVHVDKPLVLGNTYQVHPVNVVSRMGGILGGPAVATFAGILRHFKARPTRQAADLIDISNDIAGGTWTIDDSGDLSVHGGTDSLRKRVFRRLVTGKGAFAWMPDYGVGLALKELASVAELQQLKADIQQQVKQEPEVKSVDVSLSLNPLGMLMVGLDIRTSSPGAVRLSYNRMPDGTVIP